MGPPPRPRVQAERDDAGFGVAAAERNHPVAFGVARCSPKNASADSLTHDASGAWRVELQAACHACPRELKRAAWMSGFLMEETLFV
jgi:hypothetical protein